MKTKSKIERWKIVLRLRSRGATFAEIGRALGCGAQRARQVTDQAERSYENFVRSRVKTVGLLPRHMRAHFIFQR